MSRPAASTALWITVVQLAVLYADSTLLTPLYQLYREAFGFSQLTLTLIYAAYVLGNLTALLFLARASDQLGRRAVNLTALAIAAGATLLFLCASSVAWLFAGRIVSGLAIGLGATATTAWLAELSPDKRRASLFATEGNFLGLALGALPAGLLAAYLPRPLRLSYLVYLGVLGIVAALVIHAPETVSRRVSSLRQLSLRPRLGVPRELWGSFLPPAAIGFATFAVVGYYLALIPSLLGQAMSQKNPAAGGAVVALLSLAGALAGMVTRRLSSRTALRLGSALLLPGIALLPAAEGLHSLALLLFGTAVTAPATMLAYRGSLEVVNRLAPAERRAEVIASYILFMYAGNSVPVIGIGLLSSATSSLTADVTFAIVIAACAVLALMLGARDQPSSPRSPMSATAGNTPRPRSAQATCISSACSDRSAAELANVSEAATDADNGLRMRPTDSPAFPHQHSAPRRDHGEKTMAPGKLSGLKVAILATDGFEQSELLEPRQALQEAGATTEVVAPRAGRIRGWNHTEWGQEIAVDKDLQSAEADDYDALLLPGGVMNPDKLRAIPAAVSFARSFFEADKPVAAICHGPWTVIESGAARGHRMTSWPSLQTDLRNAGAQWVDEEVVVDGKLVTSRKPDDIPAFNRATIELFAAECAGR